MPVVTVWQHIFDVRDYFVQIMGVPVNLKQVCFSAQFNVAIIATRFAVRSLSDAT
jgi:uncharacterized membrane protein YpjA